MVIGYLTNDLFTNYNCTIWQGIKQTCDREKINFHYFSGGQVNSPYINQYSRNIIYNMISAKLIDGLIINSASIFNYATEKEILLFYKKFKNLPFVNIGIKIGDIPTVQIENSNGMKETMQHLIHHHGYKKFAFIKGPENSLESEIRYNTCKKALEKSGIPIDPDLIEHGNYTITEGARCFEKIMRKNKKFDVLVAASDDTAIGVLHKAQKMGITIPNELALTGFDDITDAKNISIPLTTVNQPLIKQAEEACKLLTKIIKNKVKGHDIILPTKMVIRRSCGCYSNIAINANLIEIIKNKNLNITDLKKDKDKIINKIKKTIKSDRLIGYYQWTEILLDSFINYISSDITQDLHSQLSEIDLVFNKAVIAETIEIEDWQNTLSHMIKLTSPYINNELEYKKAVNFWQLIRTLIQEFYSRSQSYLKMKSEISANTFRVISSQLITSFNLKQLSETIQNGLPSIGVTSCYLSLYENRKKSNKYSYLIIAYDENGRIELPEKGIRFETKDILPARIKPFRELTNYILEPVFFNEEQFGFILLKTNPQKVVFDALTQQISSAIKGAILIEEVIEKEAKLKVLLKDQKKRSRELHTAYQKLKENQDKMLIIEKMASLGRLTAGLAHEINTPLATVGASTIKLESLTNEYSQSIGDPEITNDDHKDICKDMKKSIMLIKKATEKAASVVSGVKSQTRDMAEQERYIFNAVPVIQEAILLLDHSLRKNNCSVNFKPISDSVELYGMRGRLSQIITNLLTNAIDAYKEIGGGPIIIELIYSKPNIDLIISDKGPGIKEEYLSKIFDPMFSTKRLAEGTGLGLTIVHDIVKGNFDGSIEVKSEINQGTTFIFHFPKPKKEK